MRCVQFLTMANQILLFKYNFTEQLLKNKRLHRLKRTFFSNEYYSWAIVVSSG